MKYRLNWHKREAGAEAEMPCLAEFVLGGEVGAGVGTGWQVPVHHLDARPVRECWSSNQTVEVGDEQGIVWRHDGEILFGTVRDWHGGIGEQDWSPVVAEVYQRVFALAKRLGFPWVWRIWQYLPEINHEVAGLERYRQFNQGRVHAFTRLNMVKAGRFPAACALGAVPGAWFLSFMAGKTAPRFLENPRQISAFHYPPKYGESRPMFARAVLVDLPQQELLLVSGTASIAGHASVHVGDVRAQTLESLHNVRALFRQASQMSSQYDWEQHVCDYRVYVRHAEDVVAVRAVVREQGIDDASAVYVQADVCRGDLLVELEAQGLRDVAQEEA